MICTWIKRQKSVTIYIQEVLVPKPTRQMMMKGRIFVIGFVGFHLQVTYNQLT